MPDNELKVDDRVQILVGGPHENYGRIATVGHIQEDGHVVVYFGDQDEDEWVYAPSELEKRPFPESNANPRFADFEKLLEQGRVRYGVFAKRPAHGSPGEFDYSSAGGIWPDREPVDNHRAYCQNRAAAERPDDPTIYVVCEIREIGNG